MQAAATLSVQQRPSALRTRARRTAVRCAAVPPVIEKVAGDQVRRAWGACRKNGSHSSATALPLAPSPDASAALTLTHLRSWPYCMSQVVKVGVNGEAQLQGRHCSYARIPTGSAALPWRPGSSNAPLDAAC